MGFRRYYNVLSFIFIYLFLNARCHFEKDIVIDGASDLVVVIVSTIVTIGVHPTNDVMLSSRIASGLFSINVSTTSTSTDQLEKTMNNISSTIASTNQKNAFIQLPNTSGPIIDLEDTFWNMFENELPKYKDRLNAIFFLATAS
jgi:hypothetical protein